MAAGRSLRGLASLLAVAHLALCARAAVAQSEEDLAVARKTFAQGVADEDAKRYDAALSEFRRVAEVKETANVRYRIASCLEALGRIAEALASYETAVRVGGGDPAATEAVRAAQGRAAQLDRVVARLAIVFATPPPPGTEVQIDDVPVEPAALRDAMAVDPGHHSIAATAPGAAPFRTGMTLAEGGHIIITVNLTTLPARAGHDAHEAAAPFSRERSRAPAGGYVALGMGGALAAGSILSFILRESNMATLNRDCGSEVAGTLRCPSALRNEVNGAHDAAQWEGALGIGLGVGGAVALGLGIWLVVGAASDAAVTSPARTVSVAPMLAPHGGGVVVTEAL